MNKTKIKKFKNILQGLRVQYSINEMIIIENDTRKIFFWGLLNDFYENSLMNEMRKNIEQSEVVEQKVFNNNKLYLTIRLKI